MLKNRRYICILLALLLCVSLFGCGKGNKSAGRYLMKHRQVSMEASAELQDDAVFSDSASLKNLKRISDTDMAALCLNESNCSVSVYDSGSGKIWRSLPEKYDGEKTGVICITLLIDGNEYVLNSQSDSFALDLCSYEIKEDGIIVSYSFKTAMEDGTKIDFTIPVEFKGTDGAMTAEIDCASLEGTDNDKSVVLKSISLLPYFGAFTEGEEGDFLVLPDGSGALVDASVTGKKKKEFSVKVYGSDPSQKESEEASAVIPAFGMKQGNGAVAAVIAEGAEIAEIKAERQGKTDGFNRVYPEFEITPVLKNEDGSYYVSETSYKGKIKVSYRFLSKDSADYIGMAGACRELLIRSGALTDINTESENEYPFNLSLIGMADVTDENGSEKQQILCDYSQSYDILQNLKAKDINSINLRYRGILSGGINQEDISGAAFSSSLGNSEDMKELSDYALNGNVTVFTDVSLFTANSEKGFDNYAVSLDGQSTVLQKELFGISAFEFAAANAIADNTKAMLSKMRKNDFEGICLTDAGSVLYSDFSEDETVLRTDTAATLHSQTGAVTAAKKLMVEKGNLYSVKYASLIVNLPENAFYGKSKGVEEIPFIQAILHGIADYSHSPVNLSENSSDAFLKCVEYGAIPYYEWYGVDLGTEETPDKYYYLNSVADARMGYERMKKAFSDLRSERITDHEEVKKNVFVTEYGGSTKVYVNYNSKAVTVSGVTVDGKSFLRVN